MVKLSKSYLIRHADNLKLLHLRTKHDTDKDFLGKITHLKLHDRYIDKIDQIEGCVNVTTLYFQNNLLGGIYNLESFSNLTHLYLQRNKITKIENLESLLNLRKIYLGYNEISVFEGLDALKLLKEVHIEYQNLPLGETMYFEPLNIASLSNCLEVLNVAGNGLITISPLMHMARLRELLIEENCISNLEQLQSVLVTLPSLVRLNVAGNPVATLREFTDSIIISAKALKHLDEKEVRASTRHFVEGWMKARVSREKSTDGKDGGEKPKHKPISKVVSFTDFTTANNTNGEKSGPLKYPPWKLRPTMNIGEGTYVPRFYRSMSRTRTDDPPGDIF